MFRLKRYKYRTKEDGSAKASNRPGATDPASDMKSIEMLMQKPRKVVHSKNPFKVKQPKIRVDRKVKHEPLDGVTILKICKCELPAEVLKLDLSGRGYSSIYQSDLKYFTNILEVDLSDNFLNVQDVEVLSNLSKIIAHNNLISELSITENMLPALEILDLSFNALSENALISLSSFGRLKYHFCNLRELALAGNSLQELPPELTALENLRSIDLSHNLINSDSKASNFWRILADFPGLAELNVSHNYLKGIHTEKLEAGDFDLLEVLDFRNNSVDDQLKLICARNFSSLKTLIVTHNPFVEYSYDYLEEELLNRTGAELVNETVSYKLKKHAISRRPIPIVFENIVVIKEDEFKKQLNTEFFGVDIPLDLIQQNENIDKSKGDDIQLDPDAHNSEEQPSEKREGFFMTEADARRPKVAQKIRPDIPKNIFDLNLDKVLDYKSLEYQQFLSLSKLYLGSNVEYEKVDDLNDAYRELKNHTRTLGNLDIRLDQPSYMRPLKTKYKPSTIISSNAAAPGNFHPNLSAFNADKKMHDIKYLVNNMTGKMKD